MYEEATQVLLVWSESGPSALLISKSPTCDPGYVTKQELSVIFVQLQSSVKSLDAVVEPGKFL